MTRLRLPKEKDTEQAGSWHYDQYCCWIVNLGLGTGSRHPLRNAALPVIGVAVVVPAVITQRGNGHHIQDLLTVAQVLGGFAVAGLIFGLILQAHAPAAEDAKKDVFIQPSYFLFVMLFLLPANAIYSGARAGVQFALTEGAQISGKLAIRRVKYPVAE